MADDRFERWRAEQRAARSGLTELIAERLGFAGIRPRPPGLSARIDREVDEAISDWRIAMAAAVPARPSTSLQRLLAAYVEIEDRLLP